MAGIITMTKNCPHCGAEKSAFTYASERQITRFRPSIHDQRRSMWNAFMTCNSCQMGVVVVVSSSSWKGLESADRQMNLSDDPKDSDTHFRIERVFPLAKPHVAPDHTPTKIASAFIEASENLQREKLETSQMLARKALDLATKRLLPESKKKLYGRIEDLRDSGRITPEMADWAHIVRDEGNDSVHDESEASKEGATELLAFTETFLMYAFTLPGMIASRRQGDDNETNET